ncbi:hypothetical protein OSB04_005883 [Centaurea solstitialis]|uniref:SAWADEE domain-containing protein n=1 Tax=Centaurea solstitialis TaxID=347529 RepID=A0AA38U1I1_9ASTR|nr:hypothetical protein OSB04_005883 [Centaurea solstitialis]
MLSRLYTATHQTTFVDSRAEKHRPAMAVSGDDNVSYNLDYRSKKDEAWYTAAVLLEDDGKGKQLRVKFRDFEDSCFDEVFSIADFSTKSELQEFLPRFRRVSVPIEDNECSRVISGMIVCATYKGDGSVRFFDAIVDDVRYKEHTPEKCLCTYLLVWQHGPAEGNITATSIEDICLIVPGAVDPQVIDFAKIVKKKLGLVYKRPFLSRKTSSDETLDELQASSPMQTFCLQFLTFFLDLDSAGYSSYVEFSKGFVLCKLRFLNLSDFRTYFVLFGKDRVGKLLSSNLSPSSMMEFLHVHTSITPQAYVFPSLSVETYARGAVMVDSREKLKRIYDFLSNPNHCIVSSSGRPWVIAEAMLRTGTFDTNLQSCMPLSEKRNIGNGLMVVRLGTEEYERAKQQKDLYMNFRKHLNGLLERLDKEEKKCLPSGAN